MIFGIIAAILIRPIHLSLVFLAHKKLIIYKSSDFRLERYFFFKTKHLLFLQKRKSQ